MIHAPIAFFAYNRPEHMFNALSSLAENPEAKDSELFIFCDAPKNPDLHHATDIVRKIARSKQWCRTVHVLESNLNMGCARSVISGVTQVCEKYGKVIVLEDDLILSPYFLEYMNAALYRYENNDQVMQISGHMFPVDLGKVTDSIFLPFITSWGWATWQRAWRLFDADASKYADLKNNRDMIHRFNIYGSYPYFEMLNAQMVGGVDSWAILWYLSVFFHNGLALYPTKTLVENAGFDGTGTHCPVGPAAAINRPMNRVQTFPHDIQVKKKDLDKIVAFLKKTHKKQESIRTFLNIINEKVRSLCRK